MKHQSVESNTIKSVAHDLNTNVMEVKFHSGSTYQYSGVPAHIHQDLMDAHSPGRFHSANIKDQYPHEKV